PDVTQSWARKDLDSLIEAESIVTATYRSSQELNTSEPFPIRLFSWTLNRFNQIVFKSLLQLLLVFLSINLIVFLVLCLSSIL
ncbi:MAG TPA: hypothetical protein V6C93_37985, partial [Allocoleopsis sp.]